MVQVLLLVCNRVTIRGTSCGRENSEWAPFQFSTNCQHRQHLCAPTTKNVWKMQTAQVF